MFDPSKILDLINAYSELIGPGCFLVAFLGSLLGFNLLVPTGTLLAGIGVLVGVGRNRMDCRDCLHLGPRPGRAHHTRLASGWDQASGASRRGDVGRARRRARRFYSDATDLPRY